MSEEILQRLENANAETDMLRRVDKKVDVLLYTMLDIDKRTCATEKRCDKLDEDVGHLKDAKSMGKGFIIAVSVFWTAIVTWLGFHLKKG